VSWWLFGAAFVVSVGWAFFVAIPGPITPIATILTAAVVAAWLVNLGRVEIRVDRDALYAGRAILPRGNVGAVQALDREATRQTLGAGADARAFLLTRAYLHRAVRVEVVDDTDPTPYWLISSRDADALAASLRSSVVTD
jgi:hypothetical protein